jgi:hypothetical protein
MGDNDCASGRINPVDNILRGIFAPVHSREFLIQHTDIDSNARRTCRFVTGPKIARSHPAFFFVELDPQHGTFAAEYC